MKRIALLCGIATALVASCSVEEKDFQAPGQENEKFYATIEQPGEDGTRVYATEDLLLRWTADDRVSIFNKSTYNQQYKFTGETGDNAGGFRKVASDEFVTGNAISDVVSVYPYQEGTKISESEVITVTLPAEQHYAEKTFGLGANTMVSVTEDNFLQYKNVGGYLLLKLYGEDVSISSITLKGNKGEKLAGKASVTMPVGGEPSVTMAGDAATEITLTCDTPVQLGTSAEESTQFWLVVPPMTFERGFTVSIAQTTGGTFERTTSKSITIERSKLSKMSPMEVEKALPVGNIVFADDKVKARLVAAFDTNGDGEISYEEAVSVKSGDDLKSAFGAIKTYKSFDELQFFTGVEDIPSNMFENWNLLTSIILPDSIKRINSEAFHNCVGLTEISIPESVIEIGYGCFNGCTNLQSIEIPDNVQIIQTSASYYNTTWRTLKTHNGAFDGCTSLLKVVLGKGITSISDVTFYNCVSLKTVEIHGNLKGIGNHAFENCSQLEGFTIPSTVSYIGRYAFQNCSSLSVDIIIPTGMNAILMGCFKGCSSIKSFMLPEGIHTIEHSAFEGCSSIKSFTIPESLSSLEMYLFSGCSSLSSIIIPETISSIGYGTFDGCSSLVSIIIPESVTSIGALAFNGCTRLSNINIPDSIMSIGGFAFSGCSSLTGINIPESITSIEDETFSYCSSISSITIPESVTHIGREAFRECKHLITISIPKSVTSIDGAAFYDCTGLTSVFVLPETPPSGGDSMFYSVSCPIFVPATSIVAYKSAKYWDNYANRIQAIP